jgi:hypothetical protein
MANRAVWMAAVLVSAMSCSDDGDESSMSEAETGCPLSGPIVIASPTDTGSPLYADLLQVDDEWVYFEGPSPGLYRVSKNGGRASLFKPVPGDFLDSSGDYFRYALDATTVYFMLRGRDDVNIPGFDGRVLVLNKDGGERGLILVHEPGDCRETFLRNIALGGDGTIYLAETRVKLPHDDSCLTPAEYDIVRVGPGETQPTILARRPDTSGAGGSLVADRTHVFWTEVDGVWRLSARGGAPERLYGRDCTPTDCLDPPDLAIDSGSAYYTSRPGGQGATFRIPAPGVATLISNNEFEGLISDGTYLYGAVRRTSPGAAVNVMRMKPNGHGLRMLGKSIGYFRSVAVDETFVYYPSPSGLEILKACKSG